MGPKSLMVVYVDPLGMGMFPFNHMEVNAISGSAVPSLLSFSLRRMPATVQHVCSGAVSPGT